MIEFAAERGGAAVAEADLLALPAVTGARLSPDGACALTVTEPARALPALIALVSAPRRRARRASRPATRRWRTCS